MSESGTEPYGDDIYTEPDGDPDTLSFLGPLGTDGRNLGGHTVPTSIRSSKELGPTRSSSTTNSQPIDPQTNGPQLFYGLRYHTHIVKPGEVETFHDQVGYWLWEPDARRVLFTLAIPRGQVLLAGGHAEPDATEFEVRAEVGSEVYGILSNPFLDQAFRTLSYRLQRDRAPGRDLVVRRGGCPRKSPIVTSPSPTSIATPSPGSVRPRPILWPGPQRQDQSVVSESATYEMKAGDSHEPSDARAGPCHRPFVEPDRPGGRHAR